MHKLQKLDIALPLAHNGKSTSIAFTAEIHNSDEANSLEKQKQDAKRRQSNIEGWEEMPFADIHVAAVGSESN